MNTNLKHLFTYVIIGGSLCIFGLSCIPLVSHSYTLGIFSQSKTVQEILDNESNMVPYKFSTVAFILDDYLRQGSLVLKNIVDKLGTGRTYHLTLSPDMLTAKQVADGAFDEEYKAFFHDIKQYNLKVLFRTMHEMNGGRYPRSSDPTHFKKAWQRVRDLSRSEGLDQKNIQFIFSFNIHDMPVLRGYEPGQHSKFFSCTPSRKTRTNCYTWEDYYNSGTVDILGFTIYNRGKATSNRLWLSFKDILNDPKRNQRNRILSTKKPIYIDEVGTTAVWYEGNYEYQKSLSSYRRDSIRKSQRLNDLATTLDYTSEIIGVNYFNVDYTNGLRNPIIGEADWRFIDPQEGIMYSGGQSLLDRSDPIDMEFVFWR
ncbi:MAG TPA: hypothetical protein PK048_00985 [Candidatus Absconditabacterales bacterium]|nr:hypothetical protein [Candidatus Absconditabacterales bacterium]